jgi:hypothetical protein
MFYLGLSQDVYGLWNCNYPRISEANQNAENHQGRGVAPPRGVFISLCVQRNEAKKRSKEIRPTSLPAVGGFPTFHRCFEDGQKLGLKPSNICPSISQISSSIPAASHGKGESKTNSTK